MGRRRRPELSLCLFLWGLSGAGGEPAGSGVGIPGQAEEGPHTASFLYTRQGRALAGQATDYVMGDILGLWPGGRW